MGSKVYLLIRRSEEWDQGPALCVVEKWVCMMVCIWGFGKREGVWNRDCMYERYARASRNKEVVAEEFFESRGVAHNEIFELQQRRWDVW